MLLVCVVDLHAEGGTGVISSSLGGCRSLGGGVIFSHEAVTGGPDVDNVGSGAGP